MSELGALSFEKDGMKYSDMPFDSYMRNRMKELGIDLSSDNYIDNPKFKELSKSFVTEDMVSVTEAWWVEKNFVGQERLEKIYSPYAFGIERKLSEEELKEAVWQKVLADRYPEKSRTQKDVWRYFHRDEGGDTDSKKGLIKRLEKLGFYLDDFKDDQNKVKLLFLLYCFEVEHNVQLVPFLSNPSIENVDDSFVGLETKNGELMSYLKRNIAKELPKGYAAKVRDCLVAIGRQWEAQLEKIVIRIDYSLDGEYLSELQRIARQMKSGVKTMLEMPRADYEDPLLQTVFLKLSQHEDAGLEMDIIDVNLANQDEEESIKYHLDEYKLLAYKPINKKDIAKYLKESKDEIINLVYEKDDISAYDRTRYDVIVDKFSEYLDMLNLNTKLSDTEIVSKLYAIAYMQELITIDKKYKIENFYYRYKTTELKTLNNEVNYGIQAKRKSQLALIRRVNKRFYRYAGKQEEAKYAAEAEMYMDMMISRIYEANSLGDMLFLHNYFMNYTDAVFLLGKQIEGTKKQLSKIIKRKQKGYDWLVADDVKQYFIGTIHNSPIIGDIGKKIGDELFRHEVRKVSGSYYIDINLTHNHIGGEDNYKLWLFFDTINKKIIVQNFKSIATKYEEIMLKRNGIKIIT